MLKDAGDLVGADRYYLEALSEDPGNADILLQLGHLRKVSGRRSAALDFYRQALERDPLLAAARIELFHAGESASRLQGFEQQMRAGGVDALVGVRAKLDEIAAQIETMRAQLPDVQAALAFPLEAYGDLRGLFDCPPPPLAAGGDVAFRVVLLAERESLERLQEQIVAIETQSHPGWTLTVVGQDSDRQAIVARAAARDGRVSWSAMDAEEPLASAEVEVVCQPDPAGSGWALFLAPGAILHRHALAWMATVVAGGDARALVLDEEVEVFGERGLAARATLRPILRHAVDPASILEGNLYGETIAVAMDALRRASGLAEAGSPAGSRSRLLLSLIGETPVAHIPLPLARTPHLSDADLAAAATAHAEAVRFHLRDVARWEAAPSPLSPDLIRLHRAPGDPDAEIAVIIPTKDNAWDVQAFVDSLLSLADRPAAICILVLNNGRPLAVDPVLARLAERAEVSVIPMDEPFNWSRFNNLAAAQTSAPVLVFANDDMVMLSQGWDRTVRAALEDRSLGAVGARLLYPDDTVQHGGILFDWRGSAIHDGLYRPGDEGGPNHRWHVTRSASAVTGAFLATRREDFEAVGGFDEVNLAVSYNDVDFCLKQRARGLRILWSPAISLYHYESKTRGLDHLEKAKTARNAVERRAVEARWPGEMEKDPSLNPFWVQATLPHRLIAFPSQARVWAHIQRSAILNPWRINPPVRP